MQPRPPRSVRLDSYALGEVVRAHVLPHLPAADLAAVRATSGALRALVDQDTGPTWRAAAGRLLARALPAGADARTVQALLQQEDRAGRNAYAGVGARYRTDGGMPRGARPSPDGRQLAWIAAGSVLRLARGDGRGAVARPELGRLAAVAWCADGRHLLAVGRGGDEAILIDASSGRACLRLPLRRDPDRPLYAPVELAPDGRALAMVRPDGALVRVDLAAAEAVQWDLAAATRVLRPAPPTYLADDAEAVDALAWSADGAHLLVRLDPPGGGAARYVLHAPGRAGATEVDLGACRLASFSPDGGHLAIRYGGGELEVRALHAGSRGAHFRGVAGASWRRETGCLELPPKHESAPRRLWDPRTGVTTTLPSAAAPTPPGAAGAADGPGAPPVDFRPYPSADGSLMVAVDRITGAAHLSGGGHPSRPLVLSAPVDAGAAAGTDTDRDRDPDAAAAAGAAADAAAAHVVHVAWSPWHFARGVFAAVLGDQSVVLVDSGGGGAARVVRRLRQPAGPGRHPKARDVAVTWHDDGHTLTVARADGLEIIDMRTADARTRDTAAGTGAETE